MTNPKRVIATAKKPASTDWHKADIICGLWKLGSSVQQVSRENHYANGSLRLALRMPWPKAERLIAEALGTTPEKIWPSRYHTDGSPRSGRGERGIGRYKAKDTAPTRGVNVCTRKAA